jgi:hypothetical protein
MASLLAAALALVAAAVLVAVVVGGRGVLHISQAEFAGTLR